MELKQCGLMDEIFSHEEEGGTTRHFNTTAMVRAINAGMIQPERARLELFEALVKFIESNHGVEQDHIDKVEARIDIPIIVIEFADGTNLIVDGNHRVVKRWRKGFKDVKAVILKPEQWEDFLVTDIREMYAPAGH